MGPSVSKSFLRDLKLLDRRLGVKWNGSHHVIVFDRGYSDPVNIHRVKSENGGYREPDQRDILFVKSGDLTVEGMKQRLLKLSAYSENIRERAKKDAADNIRHMTLDGKRQLANAAVRLTNQGKGNSTFRRVDTKRKGRTYDEIKSGATA
jgi:hypothetical protein